MEHKVRIEFTGKFWDLDTDENQIFDDLHDPIYKTIDHYNGCLKVARIELPLSQFRILQTIKIGTECKLTTATLLEVFCYCNPSIEVVANSELKDIGVDKKIVAKVYIDEYRLLKNAIKEDNKENLEFYMLMGMDLNSKDVNIIRPLIEEIVL